MPGNPSGGTLATVLSTMDGTIPKADAIASQESWALSPSAYRPRILMLHPQITLIVFLVKGKKRPQRLVYTLPFTKWVGGRSLMEFVDVPIVQRTWGLNELRHQTLTISSSPHAKDEDKLVPYAGPNFTYEEFGKTQRFGQLGALLWSVGLAVVLGSLMLIPPLRWFVRKFGPPPGTGPSDEFVVIWYASLCGF
jgi:hypothetical protein